MSIVSADIKHYLSGGAANADPAASLGGAISSTQVTDNTKNNIFDDVSSAEASAGDTEYRGLYFKNTHATLTFQDARIYISQATSSADTEIDIGVAAEAVDTTISTVANESTAPAGVVFSRPTTYAGGLQLNGSTGLAAGSYRGYWIKRTVSASAVAASDTFQITCEGLTA